MNNKRLDEHYGNAHRKNNERVHTTPQPNSQNISNEGPGKNEGTQNRVGKNVQYCHFWNNYGSCHFEKKNGRPCKYAHAKAPACKYAAKCNRQKCMFSHPKRNENFLGQSPHFQPQPQKFQTTPQDYQFRPSAQNHGLWEMFQEMMNQFNFPGQMRGNPGGQ